MATITLEYDGHNSTIKKLIEVLLSLGAKEKMTEDTTDKQKQMVNTFQNRI